MALATGAEFWLPTGDCLATPALGDLVELRLAVRYCAKEPELALFAKDCNFSKDWAMGGAGSLCRVNESVFISMAYLDNEDSNREAKASERPYLADTTG